MRFKEYLVEEPKGIIDKEEDSMVIYNLRTTKYSSREVIGQQKGGQNRILESTTGKVKIPGDRQQNVDPVFD